MPLLAGLLGNAFASVVGFFAAIMGKKLAVGAALAAFLIAGWVAVQLALLAIWNGIGFAIPAAMQQPLAIVAYLLPSNMSACVGALVSALIFAAPWGILAAVLWRLRHRLRRRPAHT